MFLSIYHNQSGEEYIRRLAPNEKLDLREYVRRWCASELDAVPTFSEPGSHIHVGCGEYDAEIRDTKAATGSCWCAEPFFIKQEDA